MPPAATAESHSSPAVVATWDLTFPKQDVHEYSFALKGHDDSTEESVMSHEDHRSLVQPKKRKPGSEYHSIVKLEMRYEGQEHDDERWAIGTGWLIKPDTVVTAGHCVYDHKSNHGQPLGRAIKIRAFIDYNGKASVTPKTTRFGVKVATTFGFLESQSNRVNDVSLIQLDRPFTGVNSFKPVSIKDQDTASLVVAGYPYDKSLGTESGAQMWEDGRKIEWNLATAEFKGMLEYKIDSNRGQSGSPVMIQGTNQVVGVHVYGGDTLNAASVFGGTFGNSILNLSRALEPYNPATVQVSHPKPLVNYVSMESVESVLDDGQEGFLNIWKRVVNISSSAVREAIPFMGPTRPVYGTVAAVTGAGLGIMGNMASENESGFVPDHKPAFSLEDGIQEYTARALVAEATLQAVLSARGYQEEQNELFLAMRKHYSVLHDRALALAPHLAPVVENAFHQALAHPDVRKYDDKGAPVTQSNRTKVKIVPTSTEPSDPILGSQDLEKPAEAFYNAVIHHPTTIPENAESFWSTASDTLQKALRVGRANLAPVGPGLVALDNHLTGQGQTRPDLTATSPVDDVVNLVIQRAVIAESAFLAVTEMGDSEIVQSEGFLQGLTSTLGAIGKGVFTITPAVLHAVGPIVLDLVAQKAAVKSKAESGLAGGESGSRSIRDMLKPNGRTASATSKSGHDNAIKESGKDSDIPEPGTPPYKPLNEASALNRTHNQPNGLDSLAFLT